MFAFVTRGQSWQQVYPSMPSSAVRQSCVAEAKPTVSMEKFVVDGSPEMTLTLALFKNVKNATFLKSKHLARVSLLDAGKSLIQAGLLYIRDQRSEYSR